MLTTVLSWHKIKSSSLSLSSNSFISKIFLKINNKITYLIKSIYHHLPPRFLIRVKFFPVVFVRAGLNKASLRCLTHPSWIPTGEVLQVFVHFPDRFFYVCDFQRHKQISDLGAACAACLAPLYHRIITWYSMADACVNDLLPWKIFAEVLRRTTSCGVT